MLISIIILVVGFSFVGYVIGRIHEMYAGNKNLKQVKLQPISKEILQELNYVLEPNS